MIPALAPTPAVDPAALPDPDRAGTTVRYVIDEDLVPVLRAVLKHEPTTDSKDAT